MAKDDRSWRVLLIDDSEAVLRLQEETLAKAGFEVRATTTIEQLDETLGDWTPDLILTDVQMPDVSGPELCRRLKGRYETAHVPVVLCSTLSRDELAELAIECEADAFVSKAEGVERMAEEVRMACEELIW